MTDELTITLKLDNLSETAPLHHWYPQQTGPQPASLLMDEHGYVSADWDGNIGGGMPMNVWQKRTLRWSVAPDVYGPALKDLIEGKLAPLLEAVHAGHSVEWDGSNHIGKLTPEAQASSDEIESILDEIKWDESMRADVWDAHQYLRTGEFLTAWPSGPVNEAADKLEDLREPRVVISGDLTDALLGMAFDQFDYGEKLHPDHLAALVEAGRITQEQADQYQEEN